MHHGTHLWVAASVTMTAGGFATFGSAWADDQAQREHAETGDGVCLETENILEDAETMRLLARAEEDVKSGRTVDGDELRREDASDVS